MRKMKTALRLVSLILILALLAACGSGNQGASGVPAAESSEASVESSVDSAESILPESETPEPDASESEVPESEESVPAPAAEPAKEMGHYKFQPKVCSVYMEEVFGKTMCETWFNLVDAVMAGEDTFACPDQHTYDWVMGQYRELCFPVLTELIDYAWDRENSVIDGVASFTYLVPYEEVTARIDSFAEQIEGILGEALEDDYSDFEKALALYEYFSGHYEYDYDAAEQMQEEYVETVTALHFLETGKGICQQVAIVYSYLLMQAGVEATTMGGHSSYDGASHEWSYVRLGGHNFHVDATFGLGNGFLEYFLMTDEQRMAMGGFDSAAAVITSNYSLEHPHPDYVADDETFKPLWGGVYEGIHREEQLLEYRNYDESGEYSVLRFDYSGY